VFLYNIYIVTLVKLVKL